MLNIKNKDGSLNKIRLAHYLMKKATKAILPNGVFLWVEYKGDKAGEYSVYVTFFVMKGDFSDNTTLAFYNHDTEQSILEILSIFENFIGGDYFLSKIRKAW